MYIQIDKNDVDLTFLKDGKVIVGCFLSLPIIGNSEEKFSLLEIHRLQITGDLTENEFGRQQKSIEECIKWMNLEIKNSVYGQLKVRYKDKELDIDPNRTSEIKVVKK